VTNWTTVALSSRSETRYTSSPPLLSTAEPVVIITTRNSPGPMMGLVEQVGSRSSGMRARTAAVLIVTASSMPQPVMSTEPGPEL
jgi:hypothetical protein